MGDENGNGDRGQSANNYITITVTDPVEFKVHLSGTFPNLDYALHMLDQARRELEAQWRIQRAQLLVQQSADQQLVRDLTRRR